MSKPNELLPWAKDYEPFVKDVVSAATSVVTPQDRVVLEALVKESTQAVLAEMLQKTNAAIPAVPNTKEFTRADARSRALYTVVVGMGLSAVAGVITAVGQAANAEWAHSDLTLASIVTLVVSSGITAAGNYVARMAHEPIHSAELNHPSVGK